MKPHARDELLDRMDVLLGGRAAKELMSDTLGAAVFEEPPQSVFLATQRNALEALARLLIDREVMDRDPLTQLLSGSVPGPGRQVRAKSPFSCQG